jgi:hypothetical protein
MPTPVTVELLQVGLAPEPAAVRTNQWLFGPAAECTSVLGMADE